MPPSRMRILKQQLGTGQEKSSGSSLPSPPCYPSSIPLPAPPSLNATSFLIHNGGKKIFGAIDVKWWQKYKQGWDGMVFEFFWIFYVHGVIERYRAIVITNVLFSFWLAGRENPAQWVLVLHIADKQEVRGVEENGGVRVVGVCVSASNRCLCKLEASACVCVCS